jgi:cytochrome c-type biogenesis protein CcmH/NrfG
LKHAIALDPKRASAHCALGEFYLSEARLVDAELSFRAACDIDGTLASALHGLDRVHVAGSGETCAEEA